MADLKRIKAMETSLDECVAATSQLREALERMDRAREPMIKLFQYYGSEYWYEDREGELPEDTRAGVLSEDLVYDAITDLRDTAFQMLEQAADILKNRI